MKGSPQRPMSLAEEARENSEWFRRVWEGGYFEGDPLDPLTRSSYQALGYMSVLHVVFLTCIKPWVDEKTVAIEIGPGRGAWSKTMLGARELWCVDALPAEHNKFWEHVGHHPHVRYLEAADFSCRGLPDEHFNYCFSFGVFCHIPFAGTTEYMRNLHPKLKPGAHCFVMVADYEKYNAAVDRVDELGVKRVFDAFELDQRPRRMQWLFGLWWNMEQRYQRIEKRRLGDDGNPATGTWYHAGTARTCEMLRGCGYRIVDADTGVLHRDPVIHFMKE